MNPMSTVDIQALEEAMKAAQLDQLRGYRKDTYAEVKQSRENVYVTDVAQHQAVGPQILREPMFNKGNYFAQLEPPKMPSSVLQLLVEHF